MAILVQEFSNCQCYFGRERATEIKNIFMKTLQKELRDNEEIDLRKVFPKATAQITGLVKEKLTMVKNNSDVATVH